MEVEGGLELRGTRDGAGVGTGAVATGRGRGPSGPLRHEGLHPRPPPTRSFETPGRSTNVAPKSRPAPPGVRPPYPNVPATSLALVRPSPGRE